MDLVVQLGLTGRAVGLGAIGLDATSVGAASSWSGSYHIRQMGRHYDDYVISGYLPALRPVAGFPVSHPYEQLTGKIRAAGVTGNVGECVAALFARRCMGASVRDIMLLRSRQPFRRRKAPDYLMRLGSRMPGPLAAIAPPTTDWLISPELWPVESKARSTQRAARDARTAAFAQLVAYWTLLADTTPSVVGYGLIVSFTYQPPREVRAQLFVPKNPTSLEAALKTDRASTLEPANLRLLLHD